MKFWIPLSFIIILLSCSNPTKGNGRPDSDGIIKYGAAEDSTDTEIIDFFPDIPFEMVDSPDFTIPDSLCARKLLGSVVFLVSLDKSGEIVSASILRLKLFDSNDESNMIYDSRSNENTIIDSLRIPIEPIEDWLLKSLNQVDFEIKKGFEPDKVYYLTIRRRIK